jgi:hypothetical protein
MRALRFLRVMDKVRGSRSGRSGAAVSTWGKISLLRNQGRYYSLLNPCGLRYAR